jgi:hypothetical protein
MPLADGGYCNNSNEPRGYVDVLSSIPIIRRGFLPCLNATDIPAPAPDDPEFLVRDDGAGTGERSSTIAWRDSAAGTTTTARLHKTWFITETNGTIAQTLPITYTDWDGHQQIGYLFGDPTHGYTFLSFRATEADDAELATCLDTGLCSDSKTLEYMSPDGRRLSAEVLFAEPPTGAPTYRAADEGQPFKFNANGFAPGRAEGAISYQWRFQGLGLMRNGQIPYGDPVTGVKVANTWLRAGQFAVELTATDSVGHSATTTMWVRVGNVPPELRLVPDCSTGSGSPPGPSPTCLPRAGAGVQRQVSGTFDDVGEGSALTAVVNWGDGPGIVPVVFPAPSAALSASATVGRSSIWVRPRTAPRSWSTAPTPTPRTAPTPARSGSPTTPARPPPRRS